ncbi:MAG: GtrA family protein [Rhodoferax sp.]|nr:GtrA family protein [Rhodoferax sp.]
MTGQGLRYIAVGLVNTVLGFAAILLLDIGLGIGSLAANAAGYVIGAVCSYGLNRVYTFRSQRPHRRAVPAFILLLLACWTANAAVLWLTRSGLQWPPLPAQGLAVLTYAALFFVGSQSFVFRDQ